MPRRCGTCSRGITICAAGVRRSVRPVLGFLRRRARRDRLANGRSGRVAIVQRFGGALNLNVHLHALVLDGVFTTDGETVRFHPVRRLTREDVADVVALIAWYIARVFERQARSRVSADHLSDESPTQQEVIRTAETVDRTVWLQFINGMALARR